MGWGGVETVPIETPRQHRAIGTVDGLLSVPTGHHLPPLDRHPGGSTSSLIPSVSCRQCSPNAPFPKTRSSSRVSQIR
jgi:hypothetical protein